MKRLGFTTLLFLLISQSAYSKKFTGPSIYGPDIKLGIEFDEYRGFKPTFGVEYNIFRGHYRRFAVHRAIGINFSSTATELDIGVQFKVNPFPKFVYTPIAKSFSIFYYMSGAMHYKDVYGIYNTFVYKPGLGMYFKFKDFKRLSIVPEINVGYLLKDKNRASASSLIYDFKLCFFLKRKRAPINFTPVSTETNE
ncbi:MAG: hypothetical protein ACJAZ2_001588 [Glaciecola sp.]|jgi:hypothetical protein